MCFLKYHIFNSSDTFRRQRKIALYASSQKVKKKKYIRQNVFRILKHIHSHLVGLQGCVAENKSLRVSTINSYPVDGIHAPTLEPVLKVQCNEEFCNVLFMKKKLTLNLCVLLQAIEAVNMIFTPIGNK